MNNTLLEELNIVQKNYLSLLKELNMIPQDKISFDKIDSLNVFWYENRNIVNLAFEYLFKEKDTYCFSAATIFDVDDKNQNSFFLLGDYHIFDDPIPSYLNTLGISDKVYSKKMKMIILNTIKDNIRIIEEMKGNIIILPLRYLSVILNQHHKEFDDIAKKLFCNLFMDIKNIEEYKQKVVTIDNLVEHLDKQSSQSILLFDGDNPLETWKLRMQKYKEENDYFDTSTLSSGDIFFLSVFGHLRQALALIDMTSTFGVIPFIRSFIPLHYYVLLASILEHNLKNELRFTQVNDSCWKTKVSYFLYREFREREFNYSLEELKQKANSIDFEDKVFSDLGYSPDIQEISTIIYVVNKYLDEIEKS
ncbi:hypothetical protein C3744_23670 [Priestia megaterium]|uniref:Uncharacterized protein n=1 Tax=Priestia megaterium TaxID=1404 RepID=A0A3D8WWV7_PRIMG|nr:hypothetical protein [Priestia megaterium]MDH3169451.1 hypothetical protein [Priestia megaterium]RDZ10100.1 hypothetical protein C3744_23670 [Priestia megaterium]